MFFENFPATYFNVSPTQKVVIQDFIRAVKIDPVLKENDALFTYYRAKDGDTPEIISHKMYRTTQYHWVIMVLNEKFDPWRDFPQSDYNLRKMASDKYADIDGVHHYVDANNNIVDALHPNKIPVTNIEYEIALNESKRLIKIMKPEVLTQFVKSYESLIRV